ncbi:PAS domain-containing protein [Pseudomonas solani]|uniref:PAS domain-containing protein n=1 Tax=Pseudomonas solani TaxID=2731552 RepID=UPI003C2BE1AC
MTDEAPRSPTGTPSPQFLPSSGELGRLINAHDWAATPLGPIEAWPQSLKTVTGMLLLSPVPIVLLWGEAGTMIYNDAYSVFAGGRHPQLLGSEVRQGWPEVADFNDNVMKVGLAGGTLAYKDQELTLHRNGRPESVWMNLDYSPVLDESGHPAGVIAIVVETTERVRAERHMQAERSRLQSLFEQAPGLMALLAGPDYVFELANPVYRRLVGDRDLIGRPLREALPEVERQGFIELLDQVRTSGKAYVGTGVHVMLQREPGGIEEERVLDFVYQPVVDGQGRVTAIFVEGQDITERAAAEARVRESEERFRALANASSDMLFRMDPHWTEMRRLDGKGLIADLRRPTANWLQDYIPAEDQPRVRAAIDQAVRTKGIFQLEHRVYLLDGSLGWTFSRAVPLLDADGEISEWFGAASDMTGRHLAEDALRENEARLLFLDALGKETSRSVDADQILAITTRMLGEHLGVAVCAYADMDPDGDGFTIRGDWAAPGSQSIVGHYHLSDFGQLAVQRLGAGLPLVLDDNRGQLAPAEAATYLAIGLAATLCLPLVKGGRLTALMAIHDSRPRNWTHKELALLTEVTERSWAHIERVRSEAEAREGERRFREELEAKVAERTAALAQSEANIRAIFETSHLYQGLIAASGEVLHFNATALAGIDASLEQVAGKPFWETPWFTRTPGMPEVIRAAVQRVAAGATENLGMALDLPGGTRLFDFSLRPVLNETGEVVAMVPEAVEKTARVKAEQALQQVQKMEAIGSLTGGIAHDFNNLLMAVLGSLELLRRRMPQEAPLLRLVDNARTAAERGASLTTRMLAFARRQDLRRELIDLRHLVEDMTELLQSALGSTIAVETLFPLQLPAVETDPNQLESALLNLAVNARDAMGGEGRIVIAAREEAVPLGDSGLRPGRYVCLAVTDMGEGMDEATLKRATEPFFTTKGIGKGTGLGLSMVHGFAQQSDGVLRLHSTPRRGTTAEIWLPAQEALHGEPPVRQVTVLAPAGASTAPGLAILAVDDDDLVLTNTAEMLEDLGHHVAVAHSAKEALDLLERERYDLLVTDHAMPYMTGAQLALEVRARHPGLPVLMVSGYAELPTGVRLDLPRLSKPFTQRQLAEAVDGIAGLAARRG